MGVTVDPGGCVWLRLADLVAFGSHRALTGTPSCRYQTFLDITRGGVIGTSKVASYSTYLPGTLTRRRIKRFTVTKAESLLITL